MFMHYSNTIHALFTHCPTGPTTTFFQKKKNIKNGFHSIIHSYKNYFVTVFLVFNKISCIQIDPKSRYRESKNPLKKTKRQWASGEIEVEERK